MGWGGVGCRLARKTRTLVVALHVLSQPGVGARLVEVLEAAKAPLDEADVVGKQLLERVQAVLLSVVADPDRRVARCGTQLHGERRLARVEVREQVARARADLRDGLLQATRAALLLARSEAALEALVGHSALAAHPVCVPVECSVKCSLPGTLTLTARRRG